MIRRHDPRHVANAVLQYCIDIDEPISNLQCQKLLYMLQLRAIQLDHPFRAEWEAWRFGPVQPAVYEGLCGNAGLRITVPACRYWDGRITEQERLPFMAGVVDSFLMTKPFKTVALTLLPHGAWQRNYTEGRKNPIPCFDIIKDAQRIIFTGNGIRDITGG